MPKDDKSFAELLKEAPKSHEADTVTLSGRLARSEDPDKFVLYVGDGQPLTVSVSAVKKHTVLGQSLGHPIVQLEIERKDLPTSQADEGIALKNPGVDTLIENFNHTRLGDRYSWPYSLENPNPNKPMQDKMFHDGQILKIIEDGHFGHRGQPPGADPAARVPFSLATPHQAPVQHFEAQPAHTQPWDPIYWINQDRPLHKAVSDPAQEQLLR